MFVIGNVVSLVVFSGNVPLLHMISFNGLSPMLVLQATNYGVRRPECTRIVSSSVVMVSFPDCI